MIWLIVSSLAFGCSGLLVYVYYMRRGQFEDPEDVKYQMFRDEEK
jgi:cbb3-type cytochrome oxidase maturation protein